MLSCSVIFCATSHFVIRSQTTIRAAIMMWYFRMVIQLDVIPTSPLHFRAALLRQLAFNLFQRPHAALAHGGIAFIFAHLRGLIPAALTFLSPRLLPYYLQPPPSAPAQ